MEGHLLDRYTQFYKLSKERFETPNKYIGEHQFKPYHLFREKIAIALSQRIGGVDARDFETSFGNWGLNPTTISKAIKLIREGGFNIDKTSTRFSPINFAKIPYFREFLTRHVEFLIRKEDEAH